MSQFGHGKNLQEALVFLGYFINGFYLCIINYFNVNLCMIRSATVKRVEGGCRIVITASSTVRIKL